MLELNLMWGTNQQKKKMWGIVVNGERSNPWKKAVHNDSSHVIITSKVFRVVKNG